MNDIIRLLQMYMRQIRFHPAVYPLLYSSRFMGTPAVTVCCIRQLPLTAAGLRLKLDKSAEPGKALRFCSPVTVPCHTALRFCFTVTVPVTLP